MGTNNPNLPNNVLSDEEAIVYLASMVSALKNQTYNALTGSPTLTAAQVVGGVVEISGGTTATATLPAAAAIITQMQTLDANAGVGSTAQFTLINANSGALTVTPGANTTMVGTGVGSIAAGIARTYQIKILTATTVSFTIIR